MVKINPGENFDILELSLSIFQSMQKAFADYEIVDMEGNNLLSVRIDNAVKTVQTVQYGGKKNLQEGIKKIKIIANDLVNLTNSMVSGYFNNLLNDEYESVAEYEVNAMIAENYADINQDLILDNVTEEIIRDVKNQEKSDLSTGANEMDEYKKQKSQELDAELTNHLRELTEVEMPKSGNLEGIVQEVNITIFLEFDSVVQKLLATQDIPEKYKKCMLAHLAASAVYQIYKNFDKMIQQAPDNGLDGDNLTQSR